MKPTINDIRGQVNNAKWLPMATQEETRLVGLTALFLPRVVFRTCYSLKDEDEDEGFVGEMIQSCSVSDLH